MFHLIYGHGEEAEGGAVRFVAELMEKGGRIKIKKKKRTQAREKRGHPINEW